jgi:hypothetical protein
MPSSWSLQIKADAYQHLDPTASIAPVLILRRQENEGVGARRAVPPVSEPQINQITQIPQTLWNFYFCGANINSPLPPYPRRSPSGAEGISPTPPSP